MATLTRTLDYLTRRQIHFCHTTHPVAYTAREVATVEHVPLRRLAKTVVFLAEEGFGMAVLPADAFIDLETLRLLLQSNAVRLANEKELSSLFPECEVGAMPPFGNLFGMPVFLDRRLIEEQFIAFNAGTHRDLIEIRLSDYVRLVAPVVVDFAVRVETSARL
jgi:Ala-tRNA(Pro) deacylase